MPVGLQRGSSLSFGIKSIFFPCKEPKICCLLSGWTALKKQMTKTGLFIIFHFGNFKIYCVSFDLIYFYFFQDYFILQNSFLSKQTPKLSFCYSQNRGWRK